MELTGELAPEVPGGFKSIDARRGTNGGRPAKLAEIEAMLDTEHRDVSKMREVFERLRALSFGEPVEITDREGNVIRVELRAHPGFMKLYLDRLMGPVREDDGTSPLQDAVQRELMRLLEAAEAERERSALDAKGMAYLPPVKP